MAYFLALQTTYQAIELALFKSIDTIEHVSIPKTDASKMLIPCINALLQKNALTVQDLACLVVNQGPGPFTTLRVVIATANSLNFATKIPLIGVDGLKALLIEHADPLVACTVAMLNAFHHDVYSGIKAQEDHAITTACMRYTDLLESLAVTYPEQPLKIIGNGAELYMLDIQQRFGTHAHIPSPLPHTCSLATIGMLGWQAWQNKQGITNFLEPLYLKALTPPVPQ